MDAMACSNHAGSHHMSWWDLLGSDGNPVMNVQRPHIAMMYLHANQTDYLWKGPNKAKHDRQPPIPNTIILR